MEKSSSTDDSHTQLRMRVFAGPNGSGKSTVIQSVRNIKVNNRPIDFGIYIKADDIAAKIRQSSFDFQQYEVTTTQEEFASLALNSGLITDIETLKKSFVLENNHLSLIDKGKDEQLAQIVADFLRKKLLQDRRKFSFETVFSHPSKLQIMQDAALAGYKVYLYFVSTRSPQVNAFRVLARKAKGGHDVPPNKIESRYYRSLDLMFDAAQIAYQAYFWDNSVEGTGAHMFAHFKKEGGKKVWDIDRERIPYWFRKYYLDKVGK